ncbi:hypothetical protein DSO57_1035856 [Entomophthora muscae]|nr:hypothetical protein DSO57_1035856 [Entomophthora muscae]
MNEVWIQGPPNDYKLTYCSNKQLEDPNCSASTPLLNIRESYHMVYFGVDLQHDC